MKVNLRMNVATGTLDFNGEGLESTNVQSIIDGMFLLHKAPTLVEATHVTNEASTDNVGATPQPVTEKVVVPNSNVPKPTPTEVAKPTKETITQHESKLSAINEHKDVVEAITTEDDETSVDNDYDKPSDDVDFDVSYLELGEKQFTNPAVLVNTYTGELGFRASYDCPSCKQKSFRWVTEDQEFTTCHNCNTKIALEEATDDEIIVFYRGVYYVVPNLNARSVHFYGDLEYRK